MDHLVFAEWAESDGYNCYVVSVADNPQSVADYIVSLNNQPYPDRLTIFRNGPDHPIFCYCYYLYKHYVSH